MITIKNFVFSPVQENTYVLYNMKDACCIIDPGCYFENERLELRDFLLQEKLNPKILLNTHCHLDHVFGNKFVHDEFGLTLNIHPLEKPMLDLAPMSGLKWGLPFENYRGPINYLEEKDTVLLGNEKLEILFTPGHSPGSICFYHPEQKFLIGGDVLFRGSIGRTDLPGGDFDTLIRSIQDKLFQLPDDVKVYPGHGEPTTIGYEKANNPFLNNKK